MLDELISEIPFEGSYHDDAYVIDLETSDDFSKVFNIVATKNDLEVEEGSTATHSNSTFVYFNDEVEVTLFADFSNDVYSCVIEERGGLDD